MTDGTGTSTGSGPPRSRSGFGPVVLAGLAAGVLLAVAGSHPWVTYSVRPAESQLVGTDIGQVPLAAALSYLLLASWGVLLVTRRVVRRVFAVIGVLASAGLVASVVWALVNLPDSVRGQFPGTGSQVSTSFSGWLWAAAVGAVVAMAASLLAVRLVPSWPEMGKRYDAPSDLTTAPRPVDPDDPEAGNLELWKAIDKGQDPTA